MMRHWVWGRDTETHQVYSRDSWTQGTHRTQRVKLWFVDQINVGKLSWGWTLIMVGRDTRHITLEWIWLDWQTTQGQGRNWCGHNSWWEATGVDTIHSRGKISTLTTRQCKIRGRLIASINREYLGLVGWYLSTNVNSTMSKGNRTIADLRYG